MGKAVLILCKRLPDNGRREYKMNEMVMNGTSMYEGIAEVNNLNKVEGFDPRRFMRLIQKEGQPGKFIWMWLTGSYGSDSVIRKARL